MRGGLDIAHVAIVDPPCPTGPNIAQFIGSGRADCGIATRGVAKAAGLGFVPLRWERFDLVVWQRDLLSEPLQALFAFLMTPVFMQHARAVGGYLRR
jgi:putative molybdopterin biosynthesis protein